MTTAFQHHHGDGHHTAQQPTLTVRSLFSRPLGNAPMNFDACWWEELTEYAKLQATVLGYDQDRWDNQSPPSSVSMEWDQLTEEQQAAMQYFRWKFPPIDDNDNNEDSKCLSRVRRHASEFVPKRGLVGLNQEFWNTLNHVEGRDILIQCKESYDALLQTKPFGDYLRQHYVDKNVNKDQEHHYYDHPTFGEQVIVEGMQSSQICIGDVFEISSSGLQIQVASPRVSCCNIDKKHKSAFGSQGIRRYSTAEGHAGWFVRVLRGGQLRDGDTLRRIAHPHPKWNLVNISQAMFGEGKAVAALSNKVDWKRSIEELQELISLKELADCEWKIPAKVAYEKLTSDSNTNIKTTSSRIIRAPPNIAIVMHRLQLLIWHMILSMILPFANAIESDSENQFDVMYMTQHTRLFIQSIK
eukprot:CAMPEP_0119552260 /NCGR_PEP_ID=MMETSP1352-20130426/5310_1 /TAXON_ID=265584 /ORGANISM="Stauroneis constricta, Strain CCMP1120" /LENGTH=411 /DNA_ID=CAMNT_0007598463 /DNA_START=121 /DNA_END=1355 /DNA_ORIENTATION=+